LRRLPSDLPQLAGRQRAFIGCVLRQQPDCHVAQGEVDGLGLVDTEALCDAFGGVAGDAGRTVCRSIPERNLIGSAASGHLVHSRLWIS
jgi:hypothetical protein